MKSSNAFESTFSQVKENNAKTGDGSTSQAPEIAVKDKLARKKQHVAKLTSQHSNKSTIKMSNEDMNAARKTFYLKPELLEIFKYAKFKMKLGESQIAIIAFESYFEQQFGKNWRTLIK